MAQWPDRLRLSAFADMRGFRAALCALYLPMQKREKISPSRSSAVNSPVIDRERLLRGAQLLGEELDRRRLRVDMRGRTSR